MLETLGSRSSRRNNSNTKFKVEKFDDTNNFGMWQSEVMDPLFQQKLDVILEKKLGEISEKEWVKMN